ncbi:MAG: branched-chain amino acid ABC transporter permease [Ideonella sp.]|nr:branched-chain amino acid ABC transporter permease [Ideonella sp.]
MSDPSFSTSDAAVTRGTRLSLVAALLALALVAVAASMPWWAERSQLRLATEFLYVLTLAQLWNLLAGYGGMLSVGQQAFVGIGAYSLVVLGLHGGLNAFAVVPLAGVVGAVAAAATAPLVFRLSGAQFAVGTWVVAEVFRIVVANLPFVSGGSGVSVARTVAGMEIESRDAMTLWVALALGAGTLMGVYALLRSRWGMALVAVRDSERASQSLGIDGRRVKWFVYVASAAGCAMAGALIFVTKLRVSPDAAFSVDWSTTMFFVVVIGGIGTLEGPLIGAVLYFLLREWLSDLGSIYLIALGTLTMAVMLFAPGGLWGLVTRRVPVQLFPVQRRVRDR